MLDHLCYEIGEVYWLAIHAEHSRIGPRQEQQGLDQARNAVAFLQRTRQDALILLRASGAAQGHLDLTF